MKRRTVVSCFIMLNVYVAYSQDIINAYKSIDYIGQTNYPNAPGMPAYFTGDQINYTFPILNNLSHNYNGEYVIQIGNLPYFGANTFAADYDVNDFLVTYTIEVVSFPFSLDCAFQSSQGCVTSVTGISRILTMPPLSSYDPLTLSWSYDGGTLPCIGLVCNLKNKIDRETFNASGFSERLGPPASQALISAFFMSDIPTTNQRDLLPHTILKHTINFHCGLTINDPIISSITWIYDNTRGAMKTYPFYPINGQPTGNGKKHYDVIFVPELVSRNETYSGTENCSFYSEPSINPSSNCVASGMNLDGGTIDYYPFSEIQNTNCSHAGFTPVQNPSTFHYDPSSGPKHVQPNPYSILTGTFPRNEIGTVFAGMELNGSALAKIGYQYGWTFPTHEYKIDNSIVLSDINFDEKKIYNPSEVDITAPDLRFPANYTFLTARGVYAYVDDYTAQTALPENDFAFYNNDLRSFPIETDLRYEGINPDYLGHPNDPSYSSIYRLMNGSKLTIEPCVHIYDCTFDVKPGAEMVFENWSTSQHNVNRYNVLKNGGTITKRDNSFLFQNRNEDEFILKFEAGDFIRAGESVDLSNPPGTYSVLANSEVHFTANNYIDLQPGFNADANSTFTASINSIVIPSCPPQRKRKPQGLDNDLLPESKTYKFFHASPNPATDEISLMFGIKNSNSVTLLIYDVYGKLVSVIAENKFLNFGEYSYKYKIGNLSNGIYFARLSTADESEAIRFIKH